MWCDPGRRHALHSTTRRAGKNHDMNPQSLLAMNGKNSD
jgi:hypothetical protein